MQFSDPDLSAYLEAADDDSLDALSFGVIGIGADGLVRRYNIWEAEAAGLEREWVIGRDFFNEVGLCMNNFMVAQRFEDEATLDDTIDYVLTFRMKPTRVKLRLMQMPDAALRWIAVQRG